MADRGVEGEVRVEKEDEEVWMGKWEQQEREIRE